MEGKKEEMINRWVDGRMDGRKDITLCTLSPLRISSNVYKACNRMSVQSTAFFPFQIQKTTILIMR